MLKCVITVFEVLSALCKKWVHFAKSGCLAKGVGAAMYSDCELAMCSRLGVSICEAHYSQCSILLLWFERKDALCRLHGLENGGASVMVIEGEKKKRLREGERGMKGIVRE